MSKVVITWPSPSKPVVPPGLLVASGHADESIIGVVGTVRQKSAPHGQIMGKTLSYQLGKGGAPPAAACYRWSIFFKLPPGGEYELEVVGLTADCQRHRAEEQFRTPGIIREEVVIGWPSANDDITTSADDFTPYGSVTQNDVATATMTDESGNVTYGAVTSDATYYQVWSAQFPPLEPGTYTLDVVDGAGKSWSDPNLTIS